MRLFAYLVARKGQVVLLFKVFYFLQIIIFLLAAAGGSSYPLGVAMGKAAVVLFVLTLIPGMMKRFGITHKLLALLMIFRRYIGIAMYISALSHFGLVKAVPALSSKLPFQLTAFEFWGSLALFTLLFLFITSNDFSVGRLGIWWYRIHRLIYLSMWFILFHVGLQRLSIWTVLMGIVVFLMLISFIVSFSRHRTT